MTTVALHRTGTVFYHIAVTRIVRAVAVNGPAGFGKGSEAAYTHPAAVDGDGIARDYSAIHGKGSCHIYPASAAYGGFPRQAAGY